MKFSTHTPTATDIRSAWCRALTLSERAIDLGENADILRQRLATDGLDDLRFHLLLNESDEHLNTRIGKHPAWLTQLLAAMFTHQTCGALPSLTATGIASGALLSLAAPLMKSGLVRLQRAIEHLQANNTEAAIEKEIICDQLFQELIIRLAAVMGRTLVLELHVARLREQLIGDTPEQRFAHFAQYLDNNATRCQLFGEYPLLARLATETVERWANFSIELLSRLWEDWTLIQQHFAARGSIGKLIEVQTGQGDTHNSGRCVVIIRFSSGLKLVYKPRSITVETAFGQLLTWLNKRGFSPRFRILKVLNRNRYGWVEYAPHQPCTSIEQLQRFYIRQGAILALLHTLEANDFHFGNLIASGEHPIPVDLETLFHPPIESDDIDTRQSPASLLQHTVLRTGLLPHRIWVSGDANPGVDLSGLVDAAGQITPEPVLTVENTGTDQMRYTRKTRQFSGAKNLPTLHGEPVKLAHYTSVMIAGFQQMYRLLMVHKPELTSTSGPLAAFANAETRVVFRETRIYAKFLLESLHPDVMGNALERDLFLDKLWLAASKRPYLQRLIPHEHRDLRQLDIPLFITRPNSVDVWTAARQRIANVFPEPVLNRVKHKINSLGEADLARQCWIIEGAINATTLAQRPRLRPAYGPVKSAAPTTPKMLLARSRQVAKRISELAFRDRDFQDQNGRRIGSAGWFTWKAIGNSHWDLNPMSPALYNGLIGIAFYLAYLGNLTHLPNYTQLAHNSLTTARYLWQQYPTTIEGIGAFAGWAGPIYVLTHLSVLWNDPVLLREAIALVDTVQTHIRDDKSADIVNGAAGAIIVLLGLYQHLRRHVSHRENSQKVLDVALACGEHLLRRARNIGPGVGWIVESSGPTPLAGMSHGTAGIAWALLELATVSGEQRFHRAASDALAYENSLFSPQRQNWPDLRQTEKPNNAGHRYLTAWCHGAPGIGLARLAIAKHLDNEQIRRDIDAAIQTTLACGFGENHSLCHGDLGNLELLLQASKTQQHPQLSQQLEQRLAQIEASMVKHGWISGLLHGLETPGLMVGLSGIGLQLLRCAYPEQVPAVLLLEMPS